ncbi:MAG: HNH endonuclease [Alphaproteobacteria bacterium]|nr:HNH endonuclease [Alphaproteobacteria bacterium]
MVLAIIATDRTYEKVWYRGREVWSGKCIHCNTRLQVGLDGTPISRATIEHILPRTHGGTDAIENVALACARCNGGKGSRHDHKRLDDPKLQAIITRLQERRRKRWRDVPE